MLVEHGLVPSQRAFERGVGVPYEQAGHLAVADLPTLLAGALADIDVVGTTIPKGSPVWLVLAVANRSARRFEDPDRFDPDRKDNEHLGFYTGIHYCFDTPLARMGHHAAVPELFRRVTCSRLIEDQPPYRANAVLRGPRQLPVAIEGGWSATDGGRLNTAHAPFTRVLVGWD